MMVPAARGKQDMAQIDQTEKAELRDLSLEEMEHVSGGEFMNPDEWITARVIVMEDTAKGLLPPCR
jgi:hypothetical protein